MFSDTYQMNGAISLAQGGRGEVEPNPMVGCVLVRENEFLGGGYHEYFGGPHAEINALEACGKSPAGATAYVTLEPCCHTDKKTPPCVPSIIKAGIRRVVVATLDPNPRVSGKGVEQLRAAGIIVDVGCREPQARQLNARYFANQLGRAYVTLKWAQSADGKVSGPRRQKLQISNSASTRITHLLRSRCDAILVGIETVLSDDPLLTARGVEHARPLIRCVLDSRVRTPPGSQLVRSIDAGPVLVFASEQLDIDVADRAARLEELGVKVIRLPGARPKPADVLKALFQQGVGELLVEGGPTIHQAFINANLADRVWIFRSPLVVGNHTAISAAQIEYPISEHLYLPDGKSGKPELAADTLCEYLNPASDAYFALEPSADTIFGAWAFLNGLE